jgi:hypothetical protein
MERISSFFSHGLCTEKQISRTSFFNTCMKNNSLFWPINVQISFDTKTRLQVMTWSLVLVLMLISIFIDQNPNFFPCMCWRRMFCFSVHSPWEKSLKSFPFKVVLRWKQCTHIKTCQQDVFALLVPSLSTACWQPATRLLSSTDLLQVVPTTCYRPAIQQFVNKLLSDNLVATW